MKRALLFFAAILFICIMPVTALADSLPPPPFCVLIEDYSHSGGVQILGYDKDGNRSEINIEITEETKVKSERVVYFFNNGEYVSFEVLAGKYGVSSNTVDIKGDFGSYIYSLKDNTLKEGKITTFKVNAFGIVIGAIVLIFPLLFTVLVEWLVSLAFKLKPGKYVVIINFITNPLINILLLLIYVNFAIDYTLLLVILEALVAGVEFWFYTWKYKGYSKKRLLLFSIAANLASWGLYWLLSSWLL